MITLIITLESLLKLTKVSGRRLLVKYQKSSRIFALSSFSVYKTMFCPFRNFLQWAVLHDFAISARVLLVRLVVSGEGHVRGTAKRILDFWVENLNLDIRNRTRECQSLSHSTATIDESSWVVIWNEMCSYSCNAHFSNSLELKIELCFYRQKSVWNKCNICTTSNSLWY
jgi:hypothetical protein